MPFSNTEGATSTNFKPLLLLISTFDANSYQNKIIIGINNWYYIFKIQVVTLLKSENREFGSVRTDRQLHVLPNYRVSEFDELGTREGQTEKIRSGAVEILQE